MACYFYLGKVEEGKVMRVRGDGEGRVEIARGKEGGRQLAISKITGWIGLCIFSVVEVTFKK